MFRDETYKINPNWPKGLLDEIAEADRLYDLAVAELEKNPDAGKAESDYMLFMDGFDPEVKSWCIAGKITKGDLDTIFKRYGWR